MASIGFQLSPSVLKWARTSMGYTPDQAAKKIGVTLEKYESWEAGSKLPTYRQLEDLAEKVYNRPLAILVLTEPPKENPIQKDFRSISNIEMTDFSPEIRLALRRAKRYQLILEEVTPKDFKVKFKEFRVSLSDNPISASKKFREFLGLTLDEQKSWRYEAAFKNFKQRIESIGIYVFQIKMSMQEARALCLTGNFPIVVLNKDDSNNGKIFSIFHETCHVLFNTNDIFKDSKSGVLNDHYEKIENFCNQFAASFLVPDESFQSDLQMLEIKKRGIADKDIQKLAKSYNVSNEVIARKLLLLKLISEDIFWAKKRLWDSIAQANKEKENEKLKDMDVSGIDQGIKMISEKGRPYVANVVNAYQQGLISSSDLSNYLEIKLNHLPKIIERLNS